MRVCSKIVFAGLALAASSAQADIVDMHFTGVGRGQNVRITMGDASLNVFAGQLLHEVTSGDGRGEALLGTSPMFCTDLFQHVATQPTTYQITGLTGVPDSNPMGPRTASAIRDIFAAADGAQLQLQASSDLAAAFQLAVWEIVSDYDWHAGRQSLSLSDGWFRAAKMDGSPLAPGVLAGVASLFDAVGEGTAYEGLVALRSPTAQDQLAVIPSPISSAALGIAALSLIARRRALSPRRSPARGP